MTPDYLPRNDADFDTWLVAFNTYISATPTAVGLTAGDATAVSALQLDFDDALNAHEAAVTTARAARQGKDDARAAVETAVRGLVRRIQAFPGTTDSMRKAMGITVRDDTISPALAAATRPVGIVSTAERLRHEIRFFDEATPTRRAKPAGVLGCEIWLKVGTTPPADPSECHLLALDTASPYVAEYTGADAGKTAYYMLRWVTTSGEKGPWSETVAATIVG